MPSRGSFISRRSGNMMEGGNAQGGGIFGSNEGPGSKRQRVALWQLALAASVLILLGLNVGAVLSSNFPSASGKAAERPSFGEVPHKVGGIGGADGGGGGGGADGGGGAVGGGGGEESATAGGSVTTGARQDSGDDGSLQDPDELWGKDEEQKKEHHDGEDGEPVSKNAEEYLVKGKEALQQKTGAVEQHKEGLLRQKNQLDAYVAWHRQQGLAPSLDELMSMPSTNERWAQEGRTGGLKGAPKVTVILNLFMREVLTEQLDSLFAQTTASHIAEVWVCVFSAPAQDYALRVVKESKYKNVRLVVSDFNFKFYGRFQMALTAPTDFVWLVDDDMIPGNKYLGQLMHAAGTELLGSSLLGSIGRVLPRPGRDMSLVSYRKWGSHGGMYMPDYYWDQDNAVPVDYLCSQWFLRPEWLQHMWSERPMTFETGEDFHVSHTLRKYANIGTYVMPFNSDDEETKGSKFRGLSFVNAATSSSDVPLRDMLWMGALKAGSRMRWMDMFTAEEAHVDPAALLIIRTEADVRALVPLVSSFKDSLMWIDGAADESLGGPRWKLFMFSPTIGCTRIAELLNFSVKRFCSFKYMRVFAPTGEAVDGWSAAQKVKKSHPAAYELAVTANLREVLYAIKARAVLMVSSARGAGLSPAQVAAEAAAARDGSSMSSAALERVVTTATATYNEWMMDVQKPAATIKMGSNDPLYLSFLPALDPAMVAAWHQPKISIHVITNDRLTSLMRLVKSLQDSHFLGDEVELSFHVDVDADGELMDYLMGVDWPFGDKQIHHRIQRGGLISAVTESFHPSTPHDYAIFLEDDIEVSPAFYAWSKHLLLRYRYSSDAAHPVTLNANTMPTTSLAGISLYTPRIEEVTAQRAHLDFNRAASGYNALLFQTPCSWGTVYFPEVWMHLHAALVNDKYKDIPGVLVNGWSGSWKKFLFSLMYHNDWYLLYPGYKQEQSFATNHMEAGVHIGKGSIKHLPEDYVVPLFKEGDASFWKRESLLLPKARWRTYRRCRSRDRWSRPPKSQQAPPTVAGTVDRGRGRLNPS
ncbi:unnamed protein product [Ectocarpus sp. CCAP 1310/34]|nr:unnamed protein product [Ectocarpus sp. CCAP 1310/34]